MSVKIIIEAREDGSVETRVEGTVAGGKEALALTEWLVHALEALRQFVQGVK